MLKRLFHRIIGSTIPTEPNFVLLINGATELPIKIGVYRNCMRKTIPTDFELITMKAIINATKPNIVFVTNKMTNPKTYPVKDTQFVCDMALVMDLCDFEYYILSVIDGNYTMKLLDVTRHDLTIKN